MKRKFSLLAFVAVVAAFFAVSCGTDNNGDNCPGENGYVGTFKGNHSVLSIYNIADTITVTNPTAGDSKVYITSKALGRSFNGTIDASNCSKVILDSVIIDSAAISTVTLKNIRAGGYGTISSDKTTLTTKITIKSGTATLGSSNIPIAGQSLNGTFSK